MDDVLSRAPMFAALDPEAAAALRSSMDTVTLNKGQVLFNEGERGERLYIITDGKMKLGHTSSDGRESLLAVPGLGNCSANSRSSTPVRGLQPQPR